PSAADPPRHGGDRRGADRPEDCARLLDQAGPHAEGRGAARALSGGGQSAAAPIQPMFSDLDAAHRAPALVRSCVVSARLPTSIKFETSVGTAAPELASACTRDGSRAPACAVRRGSRAPPATGMI